MAAAVPPRCGLPGPEDRGRAFGISPGRAVVSRTLVSRRGDFAAEGIPLVGDELNVRITAEALEAAGFARAMQAIAASAQAQKQ